MKKHEQYMKIALELAKKGNPSPNPYVGAVLVKNEKIIGKGFHKKAGKAHAEIEAINSVKNKLQIKDSILYVTLEPCSHYGKTPPCTNAIIKNKISEVIIAVEDPTKKVNGIEVLRKHGIKTKTGILKKEAEELNEIFFHYSKTKKPFVALKVASTKNNKVGIKNKRVEITGKKSDNFSHKLRAKYDAILVGINTILIDNPKLTCRIKNGKDPLRIILDSKLKIPLNAKVLKDKNILVVSTKNANKTKLKTLRKKGFEVLIIGNSKINLKSLLKVLGKKQITSLLVEGGSKVHESFLKQNLINKFYIFKSPKTLEKNSIPLFNNFKPKLKIKQKLVLGKDKLVIAYPKN